MKKIILNIFLLVSFCANAQNKVVELSLPKSNKTAIEIMFRNGSSCDPEGKEGLTALTVSTLMGGGTRDYSNTQLGELTFPWSATYYGSVDKEVSVLMFEVPAAYLDRFYDAVVKGLLLTPSFKEEDFEREKSNQQNYVDQLVRTSSDEEYGKLWLEDMLFRGTPYQHMVSGTSTGVKAITLDDVKTHWKNFFTRNNYTIGLAGNYSAAFKEKMMADLQLLSAVQPTLPASPKPAMPDGLNVEIVAKEGALGSAISAGFPMDITRAKDDFAALMVANSWLGEHRKSYSRLYQKIREARSMNYGDYTYIEWYNNGGGNMLPPFGTPRSSNYFSIWLRPVQTASGLKGQYEELKDISIGHAQYALRMTLREMDLLIGKGMDAKAFEETRDFLKSYMKLYTQSLSSQLGYMVDASFYGRKNYITEMNTLLSNLTVEDVNKAMKKYWQTKNMHIAIITDVTEAEPLAKSLRTNAPSPMSYSNTLKSVLTEQILEEDKQVENYSMPVKSVTIVDNKDTFMKSPAKENKGTIKMAK